MRQNSIVRTERIASDISGLAALTDPGRPWTRRAFTPMFGRGREFIEERMREAGLETRIDAAGNLIGRRAGRAPGRGVLLVGSHSDTVPDGGRFDGIAGVAAALEVARALRDRGVELAHDLEIVDFLAEEVSIFGVSCVGSRGMTGQLPAAWLDRETDGRDLRLALKEAGGDAEQLAPKGRADIKGFLELHIEQGPVLEAERCDIGIVTAIAGITRIAMTVEGRADHAGTTPMDRRNDALVTGSRLVLSIRDKASELAKGPQHFTATVGGFNMEPNAANVVPSRVTLLIDARAEQRSDMERFLAWLREEAASHGLAGPEVVSDNYPCPCDPHVLDLLARSADRLDVKHRRMASGAGHDTAWISKVAPAAMIFVPCREGRSHSADEWAETEDIALGAAVLLETILEMDARPAGTESGELE